MKTTHDQESEFDREMRRDPIVKLYQKLSVDSAPSKPSPELLAAYRSITQHRRRQSLFSTLKSWIKKFSDGMMPDPIGWRVPVSLAAGVVFGVIIAPLWQASLHPENAFQDHPLGGFRNGEVPTGDSPSTQPNKTKLTPEEWLEEIANLIFEGKIDQAEAQLQGFKTQYPDYQKSND